MRGKKNNVNKQVAMIDTVDIGAHLNSSRNFKETAEYKQIFINSNYKYCYCSQHPISHMVFLNPKYSNMPNIKISFKLWELKHSEIDEFLNYVLGREVKKQDFHFMRMDPFIDLAIHIPIDASIEFGGKKVSRKYINNKSKCGTKYFGSGNEKLRVYHKSISHKFYDSTRYELELRGDKCLLKTFSDFELLLQEEPFMKILTILKDKTTYLGSELNSFWHENILAWLKT